ncbi:CIR protein PIR protein [Plasmodium vinckei brucechwatti]|uniref:CIR protein PIR protein n=1 Tax=Plasmodium vinckei brucechwatti TaxID=119398 RepID=A0A6V7SLM4_PLAVN|nr:CIR protein PIR protein [Plasmodium vinckei brucechwatti]
MAPYSIEDLYSVFNKIDRYFYENKDGSEFTHGSISKYCPYNSTFKSGVCFDYLRMASSGVINLLENLKDKNGLEYDKLAEYAILFLSYKLKQHSQHKSTNLNTFYANHIEKNEYYNKIEVNGLTCKEIIDKKKDLMNTNEISKFNGPFSILVLLYNEIKKRDVDCTKYSTKANEFADKFKELNNDSNINGNTSYRKLLSILSDDYNNLINKCPNFQSLPEIKTPPSKLIPVLSTIPVIPVLLGIAYKYSLFGIDKLFQRRYIRKKLKKVKKKLKLNI